MKCPDMIPINPRRSLHSQKIWRDNPEAKARTVAAMRATHRGRPFGSKDKIKLKMEEAIEDAKKQYTAYLVGKMDLILKQSIKMALDTEKPSADMLKYLTDRIFGKPVQPNTNDPGETSMEALRAFFALIASKSPLQPLLENNNDTKSIQPPSQALSEPSEGTGSDNDAEQRLASLLGRPDVEIK